MAKIASQIFKSWWNCKTVKSFKLWNKNSFKPWWKCTNSKYVSNHGENENLKCVSKLITTDLICSYKGMDMDFDIKEKDDVGPNKVLLATKLFTSDPSEPVLLRIPDNGTQMETLPPISVPGLLQLTVAEYPFHPALSYKDAEGTWKTINYREYGEAVKICAKAFIKLGLERSHSVGILGFNSPEWFISSLAAISAGGFAAGIYTTNSPLACLHCAEQGKANIIVVQDEMQLKKIQEIRDKLPHLKTIIQYEGETSDPTVLNWQQLMEIGHQQADDKLNERLQQIAINECCMLVYTSGTIGKPKAVMINHDNITWNALTIAERLGAIKTEEHLISYLPLSHIAAQIVDIYLAITIAATVHFADKDALKGSLVDSLQEARPTFFLGVPRVWEKIYEKMMQIGSRSGPIKKAIANRAKSCGLRHNIKKMNGIESDSWAYTFARRLVFKRIRKALGLDRCRSAVSAAAPLSSDIKKYFLSIDIPIMEAFGMSEASGAHTLSCSTSFNLNSIGPALSGMRTKIIVEDEDNLTGEICLYGRHVFMGYLGEPEKTAEAIDNNGWLHSGDYGYIDERGFVYITGRKKELLITAGGENIPPVPIEQSLKSVLPQISNAMLIGDRRKFLSMLISLKTEVDSEGVPLDKLTEDNIQWLQNLGCPADTLTTVLQNGPDPRLMKAIQDAIDQVNKIATSNAQKIQKFTILPSDFSIATGELGPTMKIRRNVVLIKYADVIEKMYL